MEPNKVETVSLKNFSKQEKVDLLSGLGLKTDGIFVLNEKGEVMKDKYVEVDIELDNMLIFPGSMVVLDDNELSITSYLKEYGDRF